MKNANNVIVVVKETQHTYILRNEYYRENDHWRKNNAAFNSEKCRNNC